VRKYAQSNPGNQVRNVISKQTGYPSFCHIAPQHRCGALTGKQRQSDHEAEKYLFKPAQAAAAGLLLYGIPVASPMASLS